MAEDEIIGWHHQLNGCEFEQILGGNEGQGSLAFCSPWGRKELDMTQQLNNSKNLFIIIIFNYFAVVGLRCCPQAFSSYAKWGLFFIALQELLIAVDSLGAKGFSSCSLCVQQL